MNVLLRRAVLAVSCLSGSAVAQAEVCGQTTCPIGFKNLYCYKAGEKSESHTNVKAYICLALAGDVIRIKGDLLAVVSVDWAANVSIEKVIVNVSNCSVEVAESIVSDPTEQGLIEDLDLSDWYKAQFSASKHVKYQTGVLAYEYSKPGSDVYVIAPQKNETFSATFKNPSQVHVPQCIIDSVEASSKKDKKKGGWCIVMETGEPCSSD